MAWQTLSFHFKQTYEGGYRYLDKCGEFLLAASDRMGFIPGESKPSGGKMEIPEKGLSVSFDALAISVVQELPSDSAEGFVNICRNLVDLVSEHFRPKSIVKNGFAWKFYWPFTTPQEMLASSLKVGGQYHVNLEKAVGMVANHKKMDYWFTSGSKEFHVVLQPITFDRMNVPKRTANYQATRLEKNRIDRYNRFAGHFRTDLTHALLLELDLMEIDPPEGASLEKHFDELKQRSEALKERLRPL